MVVVVEGCCFRGDVVGVRVVGGGDVVVVVGGVIVEVVATSTIEVVEAAVFGGESSP